MLSVLVTMVPEDNDRGVAEIVMLFGLAGRTARKSRKYHYFTACECHVVRTTGEARVRLKPVYAHSREELRVLLLKSQLPGTLAIALVGASVAVQPEAEIHRV